MGVLVKRPIRITVCTKGSWLIYQARFVVVVDRIVFAVGQVVALEGDADLWTDLVAEAKTPCTYTQAQWKFQARIV
jgi:hypothetical protein